MAEPLKNSFGPEVPERIGRMVEEVYGSFDRPAFMAAALAGYEDLELTARARQISDALAGTLPTDRARAIEILVESLGSKHAGEKLTGIGSFLYCPHVFFVADHGLDCYETSMRAQYELTQRFTADLEVVASVERAIRSRLACPTPICPTRTATDLGDKCPSPSADEGGAHSDRRRTHHPLADGAGGGLSCPTPCARQHCCLARIGRGGMDQGPPAR